MGLGISNLYGEDLTVELVFCNPIIFFFSDGSFFLVLYHIELIFFLFSFFDLYFLHRNS